MTSEPGSPVAVLQELEIGANARCFTLGGETPTSSFGVNCVALWGDRETLLVDPLIAPAHARMVVEAVARAGLPPIGKVVLTHHHTDHALGAGFLARQGVTVLAHPRCAEAMDVQHPGIVASRRRDPAFGHLFADATPFQPTRRVEEVEVLDLGGVRVEVHPLGDGHTAGDCVVVAPGDGVVVAGDLLFDGYHFNYEEADPGLARRRLDLLADLGSRFVPGHGRVGGPERLEAQRRYHDEAERISRGNLPSFGASHALRLRFPNHLLASATDTAVRAWRSTPYR